MSSNEPNRLSRPGWLPSAAATLGEKPPYADHYEALPPLPVPALSDTIARTKDSLEPLVDDATFARLSAQLDALGAAGGVGERLQTALEAKAANADNWLAAWWDDIAYLAIPDPLLINSNFGISCDARQPADDQALRAAEVAARTADFAVQLSLGAWRAETAGKAAIPLDMSLFPKILGATRLPGRNIDEVAAFGAEAKHIVVVRRGRYYRVDVLGDVGRTATVADLADDFRTIIADADNSDDADPLPIAALTAERRPLWAMERERLLGDPVNAEALAAIESAMFIVYLDEDSYDDFNATARAAIHGRAGQRWMDKVFAYVVDASGRVSLHGEHSPADGMQFVTIFDHGCDKAARGVFRSEASELRRDEARPAPTELTWRFDQNTRVAIQTAVTHFDAKTQDLDLDVLHFDAFGKDVMKTLKVGPDSFVQMAYQLAHWRLHARTPKTYESAQTRMFRLGRTETIRSASTESLAFCKAMDDASVDTAETERLLRGAIDVHGRRGKEAASGQGVDRHLLGLKLIAAEIGEGVPDFFAEEINTRSWELSTAQLPMNALLVNGFGPVAPNGYGIGYVIQSDHVTCHVTSYRSDPDTTSGGFTDAIDEAMRDIRALLESATA